MKMKYLLEKGENNELIINELSALDKKNNEVYTLLCEQKYEGEVIEAAISKGKRALISALRTPNLYPLSAYMGKIVESIIAIYGPEKQESAEIYFDDTDLLAMSLKEKAMLEDIEDDIEDDQVEIDELLKGEDDIKNIKTTIRVADEDVIDIEKENNKLSEE